MHDDAYIGGRSENNIKCVVHDDLGWKNQTTHIFCHITGFTSDFLSFVVVELIRFFRGALQLSVLIGSHVFRALLSVANTQ